MRERNIVKVMVREGELVIESRRLRERVIVREGERVCERVGVVICVCVCMRERETLRF